MPGNSYAKTRYLFLWQHARWVLALQGECVWKGRYASQNFCLWSRFLAFTTWCLAYEENCGGPLRRQTSSSFAVE